MPDKLLNTYTISNFTTSPASSYYQHFTSEKIDGLGEGNLLTNSHIMRKQSWIATQLSVTPNCVISYCLPMSKAKGIDFC